MTATMTYRIHCPTVFGSVWLFTGPSYQVGVQWGWEPRGAGGGAGRPGGGIQHVESGAGGAGSHHSAGERGPRHLGEHGAAGHGGSSTARLTADRRADSLQWVHPAQVAALLAHLASDAGAQVTGAAIPLYGRPV